MYSILLITNNDDNFYDIKIKLSDSEKYKKKFNLKKNNNQKVYYKNNIEIISDTEDMHFYKVIEKDIYVKEKYLFIEHEKIKINPFTFYETDYEEEYTLYQNKINDIIINFKEYQSYCELEFITEDLNKFNKLISE
mgnify:CR=1 FL=1